MNRSLLSACACCSITLLAGCVQPTPIVDSHLGDSLTMLKAQQILHPEAVRNTDPVAGIDGRAGKAGYDQYQKSYSTPEPPSNAFTIGVSSGR